MNKFQIQRHNKTVSTLSRRVIVVVNGLIRCSENCQYQENGECALDNVPKYCLQLNSKKACIYYKKREDPKEIGKEKPNFEVYY